MNKSIVTTFLSIILSAVGYYFQQPILLSAGLFALSGAVTNWLAIHMLFEKVPFLYGSGVIPARFESFKSAIKTMMMTEFFTPQNIEQFLPQKDSNQPVDLSPVIQSIDFSPTFDSLVDVIMQSSFGSMIGVFGGAEALQPLKQPFVDKMQDSITQLTQTEQVQQAIKGQLKDKVDNGKIQQKIELIIDQRLDELTPQIVKAMVQKMIKEHLGWLVVWGGVFGGLLGGVAAFIS